MSILKKISDLIDDCLTSPPPVPSSLKDPNGEIAKPRQLQIEPTGHGIEKWIGEIKKTADSSEPILIRVLQVKFPRVAEILTLLQVIKFTFEGNQIGVQTLGLDWEKIEKLLSNPDQVALKSILDRVADLDDVKALQALVLMLTIAPMELLSLEYKREGFLGLPIGESQATDLQDLINLINSPIGVALPPERPVNNLHDFILLAKSNSIGTVGRVSIQGPDTFYKDKKLDGFGIELVIPSSPSDLEFDLGENWKLTLHPDSSSTFPRTYQIFIGADGLDISKRSDQRLQLRVKKEFAEQRLILLGEPNSTNIKLKSFEVDFCFLAGSQQNTALFKANVNLSKLSFEIDAKFLDILSLGIKLPNFLKFESDIEFGFVQGNGFTGQHGETGSATLGMQFAGPIGLKIGSGKTSVRVDHVDVRLETKVNADTKSVDFRSLFRFSTKGEFGPVNVTVEGAGLWLGIWNSVYDDVLNANKLGILVDAGPVRGGGYLGSNLATNEYSGALQLKVLGIAVFAFGVYRKDPGKDPSFVAMIGIRLPFPGIQLGFGFSVSGFGGLVGINRRADTDMLRERLAAGTSGDVLFNDDPVKNATRLLESLPLLFPPELGVFIVGPTLQINWLSILRLDLGVFIELPGPRKIFLAGSARLQIGPGELPLIHLRMDFVGGVDLTKSLIFFDAALVNSHIMQIFRISGGVTLRLGYGASGSFLFSVGGFHPQYHPIGVELPTVPRVGVSMSVADLVWMKLQMYLALTPCTVQFGARIEAGIKLGPISANGWFGFDALIYLNPLAFVAEIDAGFDIRVMGESLYGVRVTGKLSGPGPLVLYATASVKILFVRISESVTIALDNTPAPVPEIIVNVFDKLKTELNNSNNLRFDGEDPYVLFRQLRENQDTTKLFAPLGALVWEQKRAPLKIELKKFEGATLQQPTTLTLTIPEIPNSTDERDLFGLATYQDVEESVKLNSAAFSDQVSGVRCSMDTLSRGTEQQVGIKLNLIRRPSRHKLTFYGSAYITNSLASLLNERRGDAKLDPGASRVRINPEAWNVHDPTGKKTNNNPLNPVEAFLGARQVGGIAIPATSQPVSLAEVI